MRFSDNAVVGMNQDVPDVRHGAPRYLGVGYTKRIIEPARGFADDFQVAANCIMDHRNARPRRFDAARLIENPPAALANVDQVQARVLRRHGVRVLSLRRGLGRGCKDESSGFRPRRFRSLADP